MLKNRTKFIITTFIILFIIFPTLCFATSNNDIMLISDSTNNSKPEPPTLSDLHILQKGEYNLTNTVAGNVFAKVDSFSLGSNSNNSIITGDLFVTADTVHLKSTFNYSESDKDNFGNPKLESVINSSKIEGNAFIFSNKFILDPKCEINGNLYVCAKEIVLSQNAIIRGNVFVVGTDFDFNSEINSGDLYANVENFNMGEYGFIYRDLNLSSKNATLSGTICRNSFINSSKITTTSTFINTKNFNIEDSSDTLFSGTVKENANINSKNITFKIKDDAENSIPCLISGNLNYSSKEEIKIDKTIVSGNIKYSKYKSSNTLLSHIVEYLINLLTSLVYIVIVYLILNKFASKFIEKLSDVNISSILKYLGIGILILIAVPIISLLLLISQIGSLLALLLAILYILLLVIAKPIFVITISNIINKKYKSINKYLTIGIITILLSLINLIPYLGIIIYLLVLITGLGLIFKLIK